MAKKKAFTEQTENIALALVGETDRGCVLAAHGHLDKGLEELLQRRLRNQAGTTNGEIKWLLSGGPMAPLQSFYVKTVVTRVLLLIDGDTFNALTRLNKLRRHFAHFPGRVSLTSARVEKIHDALNRDSKAWILAVSKAGLLGTTSHSQAHGRFVYVALVLINLIDSAIGSVITQGPFTGLVSK